MPKQILFDYIVFSLLKKQLENDGYSWNEVNINNDFGKQKLSLIPFFICIANGTETRAKLFGKFDNFTTNELGIIEQEIVEYISNVNANYNCTNHKLEINPNFLTLLQGMGSVPLRSLPIFNNAFIAADELYNAVDKSIDVLCFSTSNKFPIFNLRQLTIDSKKHAIWEIYEFILKGVTDKIQIDHLKTCKSIYSPENSLLQITI